MDARECQLLPAEAYCQPDLFKTGYDTKENNGDQYKKGLELGKNCQRIAIGCNGCWGGRTKDGGVITSYEMIGYHRGTAALLQGILDSGVELWVYRYGQEYGTHLNSLCTTGEVGRRGKGDK